MAGVMFGALLRLEMGTMEDEIFREGVVVDEKVRLVSIAKIPEEMDLI